MNTKLSIQEMKALLFIKQHLLRGSSPSVRELTEHLGYASPQSGQRLIASLIEQGYIRRTTDKKLELRKLDTLPKTRTQKTVSLPILGYVSCGAPIMAEEAIEGYLRVSESVLSRGQEHFILRAMGDSMEKADICEGDYVVIRKGGGIHNNDIVLAFLDDEATIKRYKTTTQGFVLVPESHNPEHLPIVADEHTMIIGKVVHIIGKWS
jgi:repressor LexA